MHGDDPAASLRVVLTVHHDLDAGSGAPGSTIALAEALERRGHQVELVGLGLLAHRRGATLDAISFPRAVARLVHDRMDRGDVDVVDASSGDLADVGVRQVRASAVAVFTRSHGLEHLADAARRRGAAAGEIQLRRRYGLYHGGWRLSEVARSMRCADGVLALNDEEARYLCDQLGVPQDRVWTTTPPLRKELAVLARDESRDVLIVSDGSWRKGADVARRALEAVLRTSDATATWAGLEDPAAMASQLSDDLSDRVVVLGRCDAATLAGLFASHRVMVFTSRFEGMPVTLIEAITAGLPVVGADIPGVRDLLRTGAGVLVPPGHIEGFAASVLALLGDEGARDRCRAAGAALAAELNTERVLDRLVCAYRTVLSAKRSVP